MVGDIAFRLDADAVIGSGHLMRCLALARGLSERGHGILFLCAGLSAQQSGLIHDAGHEVIPLALPESAGDIPRDVDYCRLYPWQQDAALCQIALADRMPEWLVVDHYGLDGRWEQLLRASARRIMAIEDLPIRPHHSDLLLDQNPGREAQLYSTLTSAGCEVLAGPGFALLRPEFAAMRGAALARRHRRPPLHRIVITMGGVDAVNATGLALSALACCALPAQTRIMVVMGSTAPWLAHVREQARQMPWPVEVLVDVRDMATLMHDADLAIGAAGVTSLERCCLGLPSLLVIQAENQRPGAHALADRGAAWLLGEPEAVATALPPAVQALTDPGRRHAMANAAFAVTDGHGVTRVCEAMEGMIRVSA